MNEGKCIPEKTLRSIQGKDRLRGVHRNHYGMKGTDNGVKEHSRNTHEIHGGKMSM